MDDAIFDDSALEYDQWFDRHNTAFQSEVLALKQFVPEGKRGAEIGVGTGRFAAELGISDGVEPAANMAAIASKRGVHVKEGVAESLPYQDQEFDFLLMVTVDCFLKDAEKAYQEAFRVLKPGGDLIIGLLDKEGPVVKRYQREKAGSEVYRHAHFHSTEETLSALQKAGFRDLDICQTLVDIDPAEVEKPQRGFGSGGFVVTKANKPHNIPTLFGTKEYQEPSVFKPNNLLREARRQKDIDRCTIPEICVLDPDGDIVEYLLKTGKAKRNPCWACYHTKMYEFKIGKTSVGIIGCAVGASFAVLLAEQMFVSGCKLLISITSAGIINPPPGNTKFIMIDKALRDEGTSFHYLPPDEEASINPGLLNQFSPLLNTEKMGVVSGKSWTTDAPYRETQAAINLAMAKGVNAVEMEAAGLYAFAQSHHMKVVCFAHLTNTMAQEGDDFEKGAENGSLESLQLIEESIKYWNKESNGKNDKA